MIESGYYPLGAEFDTNAPYNEVEVPDKEFDVTCCQTLSKTVTVTTNNYIPGASGVDYEPDDEGGVYASGWQEDDDTSETDWSEEYHSNDYHTPEQLLQLFKQCLTEMASKENYFKSKIWTEHLISECDGWIEDEIEFLKD